MNWSTKWGDGKPVVSEAKEQNVVDFVKHLGYETKTIEVKQHNMKRIVEVTVVGDLGLDFDENGWNIYHIPTLACFDNAVPPCNPDKEENLWLYDYDKLPLLNWMHRVQFGIKLLRPPQKIDNAWQVLRLLTPQNYLDKGVSAKEIVQKWCLSVKVE
jgi:hypothetical protein